MSDDAQAAIVERKPSARTVVLAAAGTGKTETAIRRLVWLTEHYDLVPGVELLLLAFSRAAVAEARRRLRLLGPSLAPIRISTIDAFASRLLRLYAPNDDWAVQDFDGRIRAATGLVESSDVALRELEMYRHVIVDEIQDLVGDRGRFVLSILSSLPVGSGFSVFGDPAQGIYDFQLASSTSNLTSRELLRQVLDMDPSPDTASLIENHRATSPNADLAAALGARMRESIVEVGVVGQEARDGLSDLIQRLDVYDCHLAAKLLRRRAAEEGLTGATLCRFNSQALMVSREFVTAGVPHRLQQPAEHPTVAKWLARALLDYEFASISPGQFGRLLAQIDVPAPDPGSAWAALRRLTGASGSGLPVRWIAGNLRNGRLDGVLIDQPDAQIVVSSIHHAKGLEWDVVLICGLDASAVEQEPSLAYVALTRSRDEVFVLAEPDTRLMSTRDQVDGRWVRSQSWNHVLLQVQLMHRDVHRTDPAGAWMFDGDPRAIQSYLAANVPPNDEVELVKIRSSVDGEARAVYRIDHSGFSIGVTSEDFSRAIWRNVSIGGAITRGFPARLAGGRVYAVESVGGSPAAGRSAGLGASGVWLAPRLHGLADIVPEEPRT